MFISTDLIGLIDTGLQSEHVHLLSCIIVYDMQQTIRNGGVNFGHQQHLRRNKEHLSIQITKTEEDELSFVKSLR